MLDGISEIVLIVHSIGKYLRKMKLSNCIWFCLILQACEPVDEYVRVVLAYYRTRNVRIVTHFSCFPTSTYFEIIQFFILAWLIADVV